VAPRPDRPSYNLFYTVDISGRSPPPSSPDEVVRRHSVRSTEGLHGFLIVVA